jgi:hypothetical protein
MNAFRPRSPDLSSVLLFVGVIAVMVMCVVSVALFNQYNRRIVVSPTPTALPQAAIVVVPSPTTLPPTAYPAPLVVVSVTPEVFPTLTPAIPPGHSCTYGPPWINAVATPIPDGGHSEIQDYPCVNGYWYIGKKDWVDSRTGDWGTDGIDEQGYVLYNADGSIADRKFFSLQGIEIPGPTN